MKLNKHVIESAAVLVFAVILTITALTNSGITVDEEATPVVCNEPAAKTVLGNTSLENDGTAGVTATLNDYQEAAADEKFSVQLVATDMVSAPEETCYDKLKADWADKLMAKVDESLYVRTEADAEAEIVGKLYKGDRALVLEESGEWTKIESGQVIGYVKTEFCVKGQDALEYANDICRLIATVDIDGLRVRADKSEEADVLMKLSSGDTLKVDKTAEKTNGWVAVNYNGNTCYVSDKYVTLSYRTGKAITLAAEEAAKKAEEERIAAEEAEKKAEAERKYAEAKKKQEEKKKAEEKKKQSNKKTSSKDKTKKPTVTQGSAVDASVDDVTLLAALIDCEAGNCSYDGQVAVGAVVMNRVKSKKYPNSIKAVIYQKGQFGPAKSGSLARRVAKGPSASAKKAAKAAIGGLDNTEGAIGFAYARSGKQGVVYGKVVFFK